ncbi:MAG: hypothetical protein GY866_31245 [Proteobacteria bacterium]|nr:hypothetical protein [Pseudomonadota bacterium]
MNPEIDWESFFRRWMEDEFDKGVDFSPTDDDWSPDEPGSRDYFSPAKKAWRAFLDSMEKSDQEVKQPESLFDWLKKAEKDGIVDESEILAAETALTVNNDKDSMYETEELDKLRDWEYNIFSGMQSFEQREDIPAFVKSDLENAHRKITKSITKLSEAEAPDESGIWSKTVAEIQQYDSEEIQAFANELEAENLRSEEMVLLAKYVGSPKDVSDSEEILAADHEAGELTDGDRRNALLKKLQELFQQRLNPEPDPEPEPVPEQEPELGPWREKHWAKEKAVEFVNDVLLPGKADLTDEDKTALREKFEDHLETARKKLATYMPLQVEEWFEKQKKAMEDGLEYLGTAPEAAEPASEESTESEGATIANDILSGKYDDDPRKLGTLLEEIAGPLGKSDPDLLDSAIDPYMKIVESLQALA